MCRIQYKGILSAGKTVKFVIDSLSYIILRGCDIFLSVYFITEDTGDDKNDSLYEQLEQVLTNSASTIRKM
jgi:hypothetical protein